MKRIKVDGVMFSRVIPYVTEMINKFRIGPDGRTAYERITGHGCWHFTIGFGGSVDYILETDKSDRHKADSRGGRGICLGYFWRSTEYITGMKVEAYKCQTVRRKAKEFEYDPECADDLNVTYNDSVFEGSRTTLMVHFSLFR